MVEQPEACRTAKIAPFSLQDLLTERRGDYSSHWSHLLWCPLHVLAYLAQVATQSFEENSLQLSGSAVGALPLIGSPHVQVLLKMHSKAY